MFPVYTGINRDYRVYKEFFSDVPCIHRDKPRIRPAVIVFVYMFPVYTGINRGEISPQLIINHVPCIHRDKPATLVLSKSFIKCSLYTQG